MPKKDQRGFSLIELIIGLVIVASLLMMAGPTYSTHVRNTQVRAAAESILNGLQLARAEAIRRNTYIRFQLTTTVDDTCELSDSATSWVVSGDSPASKCGASPVDEKLAWRLNESPHILQTREAGNRGAIKANIGTGGAGSEFVLTFNGMGRLAAGTKATIRLLPQNDDCTNTRCLCITVSTAGQTRLCNPAISDQDWTDPQACFDNQVRTCNVPPATP